jgi:hypothetical protein
MPKLITQNKNRTKQNTWLALFITVWVSAGFGGVAESTNTMITLNLSEQQLEKIIATKNSQLQLINDSVTTLYNFTVIQIPSGKRMVSINNIEPNASFNIAFDRPGTYVACYSNKKVLNKNTCL